MAQYVPKENANKLMFNISRAEKQLRDLTKKKWQ